MKNILLFPECPLPENLGFKETHFIDLKNKKSKLKIFWPKTESELRKTNTKNYDIIIGLELLHEKDTLHYPRSGLDQAIMKEIHCMIGFSFENLVNSPHLINRMKLNYKLAKKYNVPCIFSNFATKLENVRDSSCMKNFKQLIEKS